MATALKDFLTDGIFQGIPVFPVAIFADGEVVATPQIFTQKPCATATVLANPTATASVLANPTSTASILTHPAGSASILVSPSGTVVILESPTATAAIATCAPPISAPPSGYDYLVDDQGRYVIDSDGEYVVVVVGG